MCRDFTPKPIDPAVLGRVLGAAARAPAAGNADGTHLLVLEGPDETGRYWDVTLPAERRAAFRWQGLLRAPVLVGVFADPAAYVSRYAEPDKATTGLGRGADAWPVPYWTVDAAFAALLIQLTALDEGLGALFFGLFEHEAVVMDRFGVPGDLVAVGMVAVGHPGEGDGAGRSEGRPSRAAEHVHRGEW